MKTITMESLHRIVNTYELINLAILKGITDKQAV